MEFTTPMFISQKEDVETRLVFSDDGDTTEYELIGVTVHTGTADGGHYYSFIRDRRSPPDATHTQG
jgi:ubiquitin C-terminal hydrolase